MNSSDIAALYRRVSTDHQDNSLSVQETLNNEYCQRLSLPTLPSAYEDPDTSGSIPFLERPGARALMTRLELGGVSHLVTAKQDRLGRDTLDTIATIRAIWGLGITPHFTSEGGAFPRTPQNELLFEIKASVAQYERNLIRDRTRTVLQHKFNRGELTGNVPFGFDCVYTFADGFKHTSPRALSFGDSKRQAESLAAELLAAHGGAVTGKHLVDNADEQLIVRAMAEWRAQGWKLIRIAEELNARGYRPKLGGQWQVGKVDSVLRSRHTAKVLQTSVANEGAAQTTA
jgi:putative DNA-invertase from lambdoid prophage Rac